MSAESSSSSSNSNSSSSCSSSSSKLTSSSRSYVPMLERLAGYGQEGLRSPVRGVEVAKDLVGLSDPSACNLQAYLPHSDSRVIIDPAGIRASTTHNELASFVDKFDLQQYGVGESMNEYLQCIVPSRILILHHSK